MVGVRRSRGRRGRVEGQERDERGDGGSREGGEGRFMVD